MNKKRYKETALPSIIFGLTMVMTPYQAIADDITQLKSEIEALKKQVSEWSAPDSVVHLAGYGAVGYTDTERDEGTFNLVSFNPIYHYQYKDLFLLEAELELDVEENGATGVSLEYATIDWLINDYAVLLAGKFLSPLGQFRQNLHPAWINKFSSAPPGFGHDLSFLQGAN